MGFTINVSLGDVILGVSTMLGIGLPCVYWAVRLAVRDHIRALELQVRNTYVTMEACRAIRHDCNESRDRIDEALRTRIRNVSPRKTEHSA